MKEEECNENCLHGPEESESDVLLLALEEVRIADEILVKATQTLEGTSVALSMYWEYVQGDDTFSHQQIMQFTWTIKELVGLCAKYLNEASEHTDRAIMEL